MDREVLLQKTKHKFVNDFKPGSYRSKQSYFVELSMIKNKIILLAVEYGLPKSFDNSVSYNNVPVLDNNNNIVLMNTLWKKQIQSMFMQIYYFKKQ